MEESLSEGAEKLVPGEGLERLLGPSLLLYPLKHRHVDVLHGQRFLRRQAYGCGFPPRRRWVEGRGLAILFRELGVHVEIADLFGVEFERDGIQLAFDDLEDAARHETDAGHVDEVDVG